jgi:hypothetical protein
VTDKAKQLSVFGGRVRERPFFPGMTSHHNHSKSLSVELCVSFLWLAGGKFTGMDGMNPEGDGGGSYGFWGLGESTTGVKRQSVMIEGSTLVSCHWTQTGRRAWRGYRL